MIDANDEYKRRRVELNKSIMDDLAIVTAANKRLKAARAELADINFQLVRENLAPDTVWTIPDRDYYGHVRGRARIRVVFVDTQFVVYLDNNQPRRENIKSFLQRATYVGVYKEG